jgi:DNA-directed RNA polymerase subunit omega
MALRTLDFQSSAAKTDATAANRPPMRADLVEQAAQIIADPPVLINMVSQRVKQLAQGRPPLVERRPGIREADIALLEIIQGKIKIEDVVADDE